MQELLEKIMAILEAQDAKIKALEAQLEASGSDMGTLIDVAYNQADRENYGEFSNKHRGKFEPYLDVMDKLEGGDSFRAIYDKSFDLDDMEGYDEENYVSEVLASVIEMINSLKAIVPPEAQEALEEAEEAIMEAAIEAEPGLIEETEINDSAPDAWTPEDLEKEVLEGPALYK